MRGYSFNSASQLEKFWGLKLKVIEVKWQEHFRWSATVPTISSDTCHLVLFIDFISNPSISRKPAWQFYLTFISLRGKTKVYFYKRTHICTNTSTASSMLCRNISYFNKAPSRPWFQMEWRYTSTILDLSIRWKWVLISTPLPL
jgi:hypothetical protein